MLGEKDSQPRGILCWNIPPPDWASWWGPPTSLVGWKIKITREITGFLCRNPSLLRWIYSRRSTRIFLWQKPREFCCNFRNAPKVKFNKLTVSFLYWFFPKWIFPHLGEWLRPSSAERPGVLAAWWTDYGAVLRPQIFPKNWGLSCPAWRGEQSKLISFIKHRFVKMRKMEISQPRRRRWSWRTRKTLEMICTVSGGPGCGTRWNIPGPAGLLGKLQSRQVCPHFLLILVSVRFSLWPWFSSQPSRQFWLF